MITYIIIGAILGAILGISGAGGAIIGIPLIMWLTGESLTSATSLILPIVGIAAIIVWIPQRQHTQWPIIAGVALPIMGATLATGYVRPYIPSPLITLIIIGFALWGLYQTWIPQQDTPPLTSSILGKSILLGTLAGIVTTLTGLGGGLLLVPLIKRGFGVSISAAIATSLTIITLSCSMAIASLYFHHELALFSTMQLISILAGTVLISTLSRQWRLRSTPEQQQFIQKWVYSGVLVLSILGMLT